MKILLHGLIAFCLVACQNGSVNLTKTSSGSYLPPGLQNISTQAANPLLEKEKGTLTILPPELSQEFLARFGQISNIRLTISGERMSEVKKAVFQPLELETSQRLIIQDIPIGKVKVLLEVLNLKNEIIYQETKDATVEPQKTIPVSFKVFVPAPDLTLLKGTLSIQPELNGTLDLNQNKVKVIVTSPYLETPKEEILSSGQILSRTPFKLEGIPTGNAHVRLEVNSSDGKLLYADEGLVEIRANETTLAKFSLTQSDGTGKGGLQLTLHVDRATAVYGELEIEPSKVVTAGQAVTVKVVNVRGSVCNYKFNFGDGSPEFNSAQPVVKHIYRQGGNYNVTVDLEGCFGDRLAGRSAFVDAKEVVPEDKLPGLPKDVRVESRSYTQVRIIWEHPKEAVGYSYRLYKDGQEMAKDVTTNGYTFDNLTPYTVYLIEISSVNAFGESAKIPLKVETNAQESNYRSGGSGGGGGGGFIVVPPPPPSIVLTAPGDNALVNGTVAINANAFSPNAIVNVEFFDGAASLGVDTFQPYSVNWNTTAVASGAHTLTARLTDAGGVALTSSPVNVNVNQPPVLTGLSANPNALAGLGFITQLNCTATDSDNPVTPASYTWSTEGGNFGTFSSPNGSQVYWTAPTTLGSPYTIRCSVSDGINPPVFQALVMTVDETQHNLNATGGFH